MAIMSVKNADGPKKGQFVSKKTVERLLALQHKKDVKACDVVITLLKEDLEKAQNRCRLIIIGAGISWAITIGGLVAYGHSILSP